VFNPTTNTSNCYVNGVAIDPSGNAYVTGWFNGPIDFGGGPVTPTGVNTFLIKYGPTGTPAWIKRFDASQGNGVAIDAAGRVVLAGSDRWSARDRHRSSAWKGG
jgi:hypothetical protein